jgi:glycosyltransferase involved in cell wall biosynthesis
MEKMKVVFVANRYPPALGGSELVERDLAEGLVSRGHAVTVLVSDFRDSHGHDRVDPLVEKHAGVSVLRFTGLRIVKDPFTIAPGVYWWLVSHRDEYDIVVAFTYGYPTSWVPALLKAITLVQKPLVVHPHYGQISTIPSDIVSLYDSTLGSMTTKVADKIVLLTSTYRKFFMNMGADGDNIVVVPPVVAPVARKSVAPIEKMRRKFGIPTVPLIFLSLGRVVKYKGIQYMIHAMKRLRMQGGSLFKSCYVVVAGDGDYRKELEKLVIDEGLEGSVTFTGEVSENEKSCLYQLSNVFFLLSYSGESFGIVAVEAMSAGLPVIGSNRGAVCDVVENGKTGIIVDPFDEKQLVQAIRKLSDVRTRQAMRNRAYERSKQYGRDTVIPLYEAILKDVLAKN